MAGFEGRYVEGGVSLFIRLIVVKESVIFFPLSSLVNCHP